MAKYQIVGIQHKAGEFEDKTGRVIPYDNFMLHCTGRNMDVSGSCVKVLKLKAEQAGELLAACEGIYQKAVGLTVDFDLGSFDKIQYYEIV